MFKTFITKVTKFVGVGALSGLLYAAVTAAAVAYGGISAVPASIIGYGAALPLNFALHRMYTFRSDGMLKSDMTRYLLVQIISLIFGTGSMAVTVEFLGLHYAIGIIAAIVVVPIVTFIVLDRWVFSNQKAA